MIKYALLLLSILLVGCHKPAPSLVSAEGPPPAAARGVHNYDWNGIEIKPTPPCHWGREASTPTWHVVDKRTHLEIVERSIWYHCKAVDGKEQWTDQPLETIRYRVGKTDLIAARKCAGAMNAAQRPYGQGYRDSDYAIKDIIQHQACDWFADTYPQSATK